MSCSRPWSTWATCAYTSVRKASPHARPPQTARLVSLRSSFNSHARSCSVYCASAWWRWVGRPLNAVAAPSRRVPRPTRSPSAFTRCSLDGSSRGSTSASRRKSRRKSRRRPFRRSRSPMAPACRASVRRAQPTLSCCCSTSSASRTLRSTPWSSCASTTPTKACNSCSMLTSSLRRRWRRAPKG